MLASVRVRCVLSNITVVTERLEITILKCLNSRKLSDVHRRPVGTSDTL